MPSAAALAAKASCSAFNFVLLVPFVAGGLESSTNQFVGVSLAEPPTDPGAPAPSPAKAGATARPATHRSANTSRRLVFSSILSPSSSYSKSADPRHDQKSAETPLRPSRIVRDIQVAVKAEDTTPTP